MKILFIEPYYSGSHKQWIDSYKKYSKHNIDLLTLPGRYWKWRMHGGAITIANQFMKNNIYYDLIVSSDMLNLPVFISLCNQKLRDTKIITYFHENQMSYPKSINDQDKELKRDLNYSFINYSTALSSYANLFNSNYHLNNYFEELVKYLNKMPDFTNKKTINEIKNKSYVLHLGCDLSKFDSINNHNNKYPSILWNHRWEYDKNPELFFKTLYKLKDKGIKFSLIVLGEKFKVYPKIFNEAKEKLQKEILHFGYCESFKEYSKWLFKSDIIPITSYQDFFGISIVESVYCNTIPLLPDRLSYPEIFDKKTNEEIFYQSNEDLYSKLENLILKFNNYKDNIPKFKKLVSEFDWDIMKDKYDELFIKILKNHTIKKGF